MTCQLFTFSAKLNEDFPRTSGSLIVYALKADVTSDFKDAMSAEVSSSHRGWSVSQVLIAPPLAQMWKCLQGQATSVSLHVMFHSTVTFTYKNRINICFFIFKEKLHLPLKLHSLEQFRTLHQHFLCYLFNIYLLSPLFISTSLANLLVICLFSHLSFAFIKQWVCLSIRFVKILFLHPN